MARRLDRDQQQEVHYWMRLTRELDETLLNMWKSGRGLGGTFNQRGHEAISVGAGFALESDDVAAPMHRDLGCYLVRGLTPRRIVANQLGRATGVTRGRDANLHGCGDLDLNLIGFISHLPHSMVVAVGAAMAFQHRNEPRVALTFVGDGSSSTGLFHESLNLASVRRAPFVLIVENNQYAYSTPLHQQMNIADIASRAAGYGIPGHVIDGNDVEAVYEATRVAVDRARDGGGPTMIEAKTMRMLGHAVHDGAEYVPAAKLSKWEARDPLRLFETKLVGEGVLSAADLESVVARCRAEVSDAVEFAENSEFPDPATVAEGVYAP